MSNHKQRRAQRRLRISDTAAAFCQRLAVRKGTTTAQEMKALRRRRDAHAIKLASLGISLTIREI